MLRSSFLAGTILVAFLACQDQTDRRIAVDTADPSTSPVQPGTTPPVNFGQLSEVCKNQPATENAQTRCQACQATDGTWLPQATPPCTCPQGKTWKEVPGDTTALGCYRDRIDVSTLDHLFLNAAECQTILDANEVADVKEQCQRCFQQGGQFVLDPTTDPTCLNGTSPQGGAEPSTGSGTAAGGTTGTGSTSDGGQGTTPPPTVEPELMPPAVVPPAPTEAQLDEVNNILRLCTSLLATIVSKDYCPHYASWDCVRSLGLDEAGADQLKRDCITCYEGGGTWFTDPTARELNRCYTPPPPPPDPTPGELCKLYYDQPGLYSNPCMTYSNVVCAEHFGYEAFDGNVLTHRCEQCTELEGTWTFALETLTANACSEDVTCQGLVGRHQNAHQCLQYVEPVCFRDVFNTNLATAENLRDRCLACWARPPDGIPTTTWVFDYSSISGNTCRPITPRERCTARFGLDRGATMTKDKCYYYHTPECIEALDTEVLEYNQLSMGCRQCFDEGETWSVSMYAASRNTCSIDVTCQGLLDRARGVSECTYYTVPLCFNLQFTSTLVVGEALAERCKTCWGKLDTWHSRGEELGDHHCAFNPMKPQ